MNPDRTDAFPGTGTFGLVGAGHLGRAVARGLLSAGLSRERLLIGHRGSETTNQALAADGLADLSAGVPELAARADVLLYLVRPQQFRALEGVSLRPDVLFVSFLAGIPLARLPVDVPGGRRVRVMTSAPDTLSNRNGIAALFPGQDSVAGMLGVLGLRVTVLARESDVHAFTALGPCLPIALTRWDATGRGVDREVLLATAAESGLDDYAPILDWARQVQPRGLSAEETRRYLGQAATPGGVTAAILSAIEAGADLPTALRRGVTRSRELAEE